MGLYLEVKAYFVVQGCLGVGVFGCKGCAVEFRCAMKSGWSWVYSRDRGVFRVNYRASAKLRRWERIVETG